MGTLHICMAREIWGAIVPAQFYCEPKSSALNLCSWGAGIVLHALNLSTVRWVWQRQADFCDFKAIESPHSRSCTVRSCVKQTNKWCTYMWKTNLCWLSRGSAFDSAPFPGVGKPWRKCVAVPSKVMDEENVAGTLVSCINRSSCLSFCAVAPALPRTVRATPCACSQEFFQVSPGNDCGTHTDLTFTYVIMYTRDYVHAWLCTYVTMYICDCVHTWLCTYVIMCICDYVHVWLCTYAITDQYWCLLNFTMHLMSRLVF